jgi:NCS1 family nucleobase:cation symporter-1
VRDKELKLADLYREKGAYSYKGGWNWRAVVATVAGCFFAWIGLRVHSLHILFDYGWFVGFGVAFVLHLVLMKVSKPEIVPVTPAEA